MSFVLQPGQLLLMILVGWVNRQQQQVIEYLRTESRVLREKLGKRRILLNHEQQRRLAVNWKVIGREVLEEIWHPRDARYDSALASAVGGAEVGLC